MTTPVETGLEIALQEPPQRLRDSRAFGLLSNQASVTRGFAHAADAVHARFPDTLRALFGFALVLIGNYIVLSKSRRVAK